MAWLSTLKENGEAEDMTAYYALWIGSTKSTPVAHAKVLFQESCLAALLKSHFSMGVLR